MRQQDDHIRELFTVLSLLKDKGEIGSFLDDILTPQELKAIAERWQILKALNDKMPQREIAEGLKVSIATVTRGSRVLQYGRGISKIMIDRFKKHPTKKK